jgi:hypothetical protein
LVDWSLNSGIHRCKASPCKTGTLQLEPSLHSFKKQSIHIKECVWDFWEQRDWQVVGCSLFFFLPWVCTWSLHLQKPSVTLRWNHHQGQWSKGQEETSPWSYLGWHLWTSFIWLSFWFA